MSSSNIVYPVWTVPVLIISLVVLASVAILGERGILPTSDQKGITSSGEYSLFSEPDQVVAYLRVETRAAKAEDARNANAETMTNVVAALKTQGLTDKELQTTGFTIYQQQDYNITTGRSTPGEYIATNSLRITTRKVDQIGTYIDLAVANGANGVDSLTFELSEEKQFALHQQVIAGAAQIAKQKADAIAKGVGVSLGKPIDIKESFNSPGPMPYYMTAKDSAERSETPIEPGQQKYTAMVTITYAIR